MADHSSSGILNVVGGGKWESKKVDDMRLVDNKGLFTKTCFRHAVLVADYDIFASLGVKIHGRLRAFSPKTIFTLAALHILKWEKSRKIDSMVQNS